MDVETVYPAYVRHAPRGGRVLRHGLARCTASLELREASPSRMERLGEVTVDDPSVSHAGRRRSQARMPLLSLDGVPFVPLTYVDASAGVSRSTSRRFLDYLRGECHRCGELDGFVAAFNGTPLQDLAGTRGLSGGHEDGRGMPFDAERQREIAYDGRDAATEAVRRYVGEELLLVDGQPMLRFRPLARRIPFLAEWSVPCLRRTSPLWTTPAVALDRLDDAPRFDFEPWLHGEEARVDPDGPVGGRVRDEARRLLDLVPEARLSPHDVGNGLAQVAGEAARWLHGMIRDKQGDPAEARAIADGFAPFHMRLRIGAIPEAEWAEAQRWARRAVAYVHANGAPRGAFLSRVERAEGYLDGFVAPRLADLSPVADEDIAAIAALSA